MRLIDGDKLKELMKNLLTVKGEYADSFTNKDGYRSIEIQRVIKYIDSAEKYDVSTIYHAHWIPCENETGEGSNTYKCSDCGEIQILIDGIPKEHGWNYCPHCGARMDEEEKQ